MAIEGERETHTHTQWFIYRIHNCDLVDLTHYERSHR